MSYERSTQPDLLEAYEENHGRLLQVMGELQAAMSANYRNETPRQSEHVGKQEELYAMLFAILEYVRE